MAFGDFDPNQFGSAFSITDIIARRKNWDYGVLGQRASNRLQGTFGQASGLMDQRMREMGLGQGARLGGLGG